MNIFIYSILLCVNLKYVYCITHAHFDISTFCNNNLETSYFLTSGMGYVDAIVFILSRNNNCTINLHASNRTIQIVILETLHKRTNICSNNSLMISDGSDRKYNACERNHGTQQHGKFFMEILNNIVKIEINGSFRNVLKLTATSARGVLRRDEESCKVDEVLCRIKRNTVCIHKELLCDNDINCGQYDLYDESFIICKGTSLRIIGTASLCTVLFFIILIITYKLCLKCLPTVPEHFIHIPKVSDNTLIVTPSKPESVRTTLSLKNIAINIDRGDSKASHDQMVEREICSTIYNGARNSKFTRKKRLTTNSPEVLKKTTHFDETVILAKGSKSSPENYRSNWSLYTLFYEPDKRKVKRGRRSNDV